jgi:hypothetical protein
MSTSRKTCKFNIDGASSQQSSSSSSTGFSPSNRESLNSLLAGDFDSLTKSSTNHSAFIQLMVGAFEPLSFVQNQKVSFFNSFGTILADVGACIASARKDRNSSRTVSTDRFFCGVLRPDQPNAIARPSLGHIEVAPTQALLAIYMSLGEQTYALFVPQTVLEKGRLGFRLP